MKSVAVGRALKRTGAPPSLEARALSEEQMKAIRERCAEVADATWVGQV